VERESAPEEPALEVPDSIVTLPLTPAVPALAELRETPPLVVLELAPPTRERDPPVADAVVLPASIDMVPPTPTDPIPTVRLTSPPFPPVAAPEAMVTLPLLPLLEVPDWRVTAPLTPEAPALLDCKSKDPLEVLVETPLEIDTDPPRPELAVVAPAETTTSPPLPESPGPTEMRTFPPLPPVADPEAMAISPLSPALEIPLESEILPLTPAAPAFDVASNIFPLEVFVDIPVTRVTLPPEASAVVFPAFMKRSPPDPTPPAPISIVIAPAAPPVASPVARRIEPVFPALDVPVFREMSPLEPALPALAVETSTVPLVFSTL
jgi:hypothetical protein